MTCTLGYRHAPEWCDRCWADAQQARQATALEDLNTSLRDLAATVLNSGDDTPAPGDNTTRTKKTPVPAVPVENRAPYRWNS